MVLEKTLESPLDCKEIQPVHPKGNQSWMFIGRTDAEAEAPILWPPDTKNWLIGKYPDAGKDWRQEKGMTEDEMVGWYHRLDGHKFEQAPVVGDGQGSLVCCSPWGVEKSQILLSDWTTQSEEELRPPVNNQYQPSMGVSYPGSWFHSLSQAFRWELPRLTSFFFFN